MTSAPPRLSRVIAAAALGAFGATGAAAAGNMYLKLSDVPGENAAGEKWFVADSFSFGVEREMKESGEKGGTEDINIGVGELQEMTISKSSDKATPKLLESAVKGKVFTAPAPRGSLTLAVPAGKCRAGARYPAAEFGTPDRVYRMTNVVVTSCSASGSAGGDSRPMESISLNYERIVWK